MKLALSVGVLALVGCADHPGAYVQVHGTSPFDHVEFFFGSELASSFGTLTHSHVTGTAYARDLVDADLSVAAKSGPTTHLTYYVPYSDANAELGDYVLAVASSNGMPVGIGEVSHFEVAAKGYSVVDLSLEPYDTSVERWSSCIAWNRNGGRGPVAVVTGDDHDCDGEATSIDCDDEAFCAPDDPACQPPRTLCAGTCTLGCVIENTCVTKDCLPPEACSLAACLTKTTVVDRFDCLAMTVPVHWEIQVPLKAPMQVPCMYTFPLPLPDATPCTGPHLEYTELLADGYHVTIAETSPGKCTVTLVPPVPDKGFSGDHHVLLSFSPADPTMPRPTLFFGIASSTSVGCAITTTSPVVINTCP